MIELTRAARGGIEFQFCGPAHREKEARDDLDLFALREMCDGALKTRLPKAKVGHFEYQSFGGQGLLTLHVDTEGKDGFQALAHRLDWIEGIIAQAWTNLLEDKEE